MGAQYIMIAMIRKAVERALTDERSDIFLRTTTVLAILILISVLATAGETIPFFREYATVFIAIEWFTVAVFTIEYIARVWITPHPREYILSYLGLLDLASILPAYLGIGSLTFLRSARMVRMIRFVRIVGRTNISYVQNKEEELSKDLALNSKMVLSVLMGGAGLCVLVYILFIGKSILFYDTLKVFLGLVPVSATVGFGGAFLIMFGRMFGALSIGFCVGLFVKMVEERLRMRRYVDKT